MFLVVSCSLQNTTALKFILAYREKSIQNHQSTGYASMSFNYKRMIFEPLNKMEEIPDYSANMMV